MKTLGQQLELRDLCCLTYVVSSDFARLTAFSGLTLLVGWQEEHLARFNVLRFIFMVALCNRANHNIFMLFLSSCSFSFFLA